MMTSQVLTGGCWPAIVAAARDCVGTRFRAQGRLPGLGLDCVGVVLHAARAAGVVPLALPCYSLRGEQAETLVPVLLSAGCAAIADPAPGDILVIAPGPRHRHLAIMTPAGVVHAHAGLGRVVEGPVDDGWMRIGAWRLPGAY